MPTRFWHVVSRWIAMRSIARPEGWQRRDAPCTSSALPAVATLSVWFWLVGSIEMIITSLDESIADVEIAPTHSEWN